LQTHVQHLLATPDVGVSYSQSNFMDESGRAIGLLQRPKLTDITAADILCRNPIGNGSAPVIRRRVLDEIKYSSWINGVEESFYFDESLQHSEDIECWVRIATTTQWKFEGVGLPLTWYRAKAVGLSANLRAQYRSWTKVIWKVKRYAPTLIHDFGSRAHAYQLRYLARRAIRSRKASTSVRLIHNAILTNGLILVAEPRRTILTLLCSWLLVILPAKTYEFFEHLALAAMIRLSRIR